MVKRGDIYIVDLGKVNTFCNNQKGKRPVVVMSNDKNNKNCGFVNVVPFTHKNRHDYLPTHVSGVEGYGLKQVSQFVGELYQPVDKEIIENAECIGHIENENLMDDFLNAIINHMQNERKRGAAKTIINGARPKGKGE